MEKTFDYLSTQVSLNFFYSFDHFVRSKQFTSLSSCYFYSTLCTFFKFVASISLSLPFFGYMK